ncbi:hypothetical protein B0G93_1143 [Bacillus sp. V-88]|nr:hypothetical protein B0G93_1143 [Bacillus sp. V-88]SLK23579.1 hypothetical protein SAMN06295884_1143 [Bacillus sp. V-88]
MGSYFAEFNDVIFIIMGILFVFAFFNGWKKLNPEMNKETKKQTTTHAAWKGLNHEGKSVPVNSKFSAFGMAACCLGPLVFVPIGLTGFARALAFYSLKYQLLFSIVTIILLAYSFYTVYGRKGKRKSSVIGLWITTIFVFGMFIFLFLVEG